MSTIVPPSFVITNQGLAVASVATPTGPFIDIVGFRVGDGFGYDAMPTDTSINGNLLYQGTPTSYQNVGDNTIDIVCKIPSNAGPFNFGEVTIDLPGTVMFAKAVFPVAQTKYTSLGSNVLSTYTFHCLLKLAQSSAVFQVTTLEGSPPILEVDTWADVAPAELMANPEVEALLI